MDRIGLTSVSWRRQGTEAVAAFTIPHEQRAEALPRIADAAGLEELVYLATCNRVELIYVGHGARPVASYRPRIYEAITGRVPQPGEAERALTAWVGEGAVEHVFDVAAGLDSAMVGETEIRGQIKDALELSRALGLIGSRLEWLFEEASKTARRVHGNTEIGQGKVSLAEIAILHASERLAETPSPLGLVGVSPMTERCAEKLARAGIEIVVFNRSRERGEKLAAKHRGAARPLHELGEGSDALEVLVCATGSPDPVLTRADLERLAARTPSRRPPLIIDMANPPDVAPADARAAGVERIGMEEIVEEAREHRDSRAADAAEAREVVRQSLDRLRESMADKALSPMLVSIQQKYQETTEVALDRLFRKDLTSLSEDDQEVVRRWAQVLARRLAHVPLVGMRAIARDKGLSAAETFLADADEFLRDELRQHLAADGEATLPAGEGDPELEDEGARL
ncbi:MAG: glutamyl-tRNA reductase [Acidobacteriota bacterium]|jgi:glutamyl-tRNA reductase